MSRNGSGNAWKHRNDLGRWNFPRKMKPRQYLGTPQFTVDDLYTPPFTKRREYNPDGTGSYKPIETERRTTGVTVMDEYVRYLLTGHSSISDFAAKYGLRPDDIDSMVFILTGMRGVDFRMALQIRLADDLLRYTDMELGEVARRSGFGSANNLYLTYKREFGVAPGKRRAAIRNRLDLHRFKL